MNNKEKLKEIGKEANLWYKKLVVEKTITEIQKLINQKVVEKFS